MENLKILQENSQLSREDQMKEWDKSILEVGNALRKYIKTGKISEQLKEIEVWGKSCRQDLFENLKAETMLDFVKDKSVHVQKEKSSREQNVINCQKELVQQYLDKLSVVSQLYTLASLSREETSQRCKEHLFEEIGKNNEYLDEIAEAVYRKPYIGIIDISKEINTDMEVVQNTIERCEYLFNIRFYERNSIFVSLSAEGYMYVDYRQTSQTKYSKRELDTIVFENSLELLNHLQRGEMHYLKVDNPDENQIFIKKYRSIKEMVFKRRDFESIKLNDDIYGFLYNGYLEMPEIEKKEEGYGFKQPYGRIKTTNYPIEQTSN